MGDWPSSDEVIAGVGRGEIEMLLRRVGIGLSLLHLAIVHYIKLLFPFIPPLPYSITQNRISFESWKEGRLSAKAECLIIYIEYISPQITWYIVDDLGLQQIRGSRPRC